MKPNETRPDSGAPTQNTEELKTRLFDTVASPSPGEKREKDKEKPSGKERRKKVLSAVGKTAKYSGKTVLFIVRKVLTYSLNVLLTALIVGVLVAAAVALAFMIYLGNYVNSEFPELDNLKYDSSLTTSIYYTDADGAEVELEDDRLSSSENRMWVAYSDIPQMLVKAYVAIEDMRFWEHNGVDTKRTLAAVYNFFIPSGSAYGGSTITQQLIKNVSGNNEETIQRKVQEIFRALNVDKKYSKTEILEMYLNTIYLSENCYGVRAAAQEYFGKELSDLTLNECAAIASIGKWPIHYDPRVNPQNNLERRNLV
ncbi:MAG: transglycosylase domain-containing protein, partial [Clostridia bacterium]|nr:transglycosylase domain-containing protein [Clostridia bacterium]